MRKEQIEATKIKAINLLKQHIPDERTNDGFGTFLAEALGSYPAVITRLKKWEQNMTLEKALEIINIIPRALKDFEMRNANKSTRFIAR